MKKLFVLFIAFFISISNINIVKADSKDDEFLRLTKEAGYKVNPINIPKSAILIDADKGNIIWEKDMDLPRDPASTSKMLTLYLVYEAIEKGEISLDTKITATKEDEAISKLHEISNNKITAGVEYPVEELIKMTLVPSSNVATIMLANKLSNNDADLFIDNINNKANELGMNNTHFNNASGAVARAFGGFYSPKRFDNSAYNTTTARDLAILTYNFLKKYPEVLEYTKDGKVSTMIGTPYEETFKSYNHSLPGEKYAFSGVDGLKTGSSPNAGFNVIATAKQDNTRLIGVVMGVGDWNDQNGEYYRHPFVNAMFFKGFNEYENKIVLNKGEHNINSKDIILNEDYSELVHKSSDSYNFEFNNDRLIFKNGLESVQNEKIEKGILFEEKSITSKLLSIYENQSFEKKILIILGTISILTLIIIFTITIVKKLVK
ncbi:D-alanyl-D-alanine carboxypeptidase family protein [Gemelliphila palaticanis]|uniref:DUF1958 domain-containing protein n=1 Tax=Gemelliphila palaticanis TaxID=81950 RepID=A0ABX2T332_9BACL|nr:serine hydrolase [Gemella palaticanis]MBF0715929.1 DUF1958 domain-containing protein [Gemella palaticanis]NYS47859.1 DUF1958 domain-containing protein [Gemella palaticanis]